MSNFVSGGNFRRQLSVVENIFCAVEVIMPSQPLSAAILFSDTQIHGNEESIFMTQTEKSTSTENFRRFS